MLVCECASGCFSVGVGGMAGILCVYVLWCTLSGIQSDRVTHGVRGLFRT